GFQEAVILVVLIQQPREGFQVSPARTGRSGAAYRMGPKAVIAAPPRQHPQGSLLLMIFREVAFKGLIVLSLGWLLDLLPGTPSRRGLSVFPAPRRDRADLPGFGQPVVVRAMAASDDGRREGRYHSQGFLLAIGPNDPSERTSGDPRPIPRQPAAVRTGNDLVRAG